MSKKTLRKQPLVYAIIHLRLSEIPELNHPISEVILKTLHEKMIAEGFQEKIESSTKAINLQISHEMNQASHHETVRHRVSFRASGEKQIITIAKEEIIIKSTEYTSFEDFLATFNRVLAAYSTAVGGVKNALLKSVGIRYVDVIVPDGDKLLPEYVGSAILPPALDVIDGEHCYGATSRTIKTDPSQFLHVRFEELATLENKITKMMPDDLLEPDRNCALKIDGQDEWLAITSPTYGVLDIDHTYQFEDSPVFNADDVTKAIQRLYKQASNVFWGVITPEAEKAWGKKYVD